MAFSPDGTRLATGSWDKTGACGCGMRTAAFPLLELKGHPQTAGVAGVTSVAFSPDGTRLATSSCDNTARLWDARTVSPLLKLKGDTEMVDGVAFSPDGARLATTRSGDQTGVRLWDALVPASSCSNSRDIRIR